MPATEHERKPKFIFGEKPSITCFILNIVKVNNNRQCIGLHAYFFFTSSRDFDSKRGVDYCLRK